MPTKVCACCGKPLKSREHKWCSGFITKVCPVCGKEFIQRCRDYKKIYCSQHCSAHDPARLLKAQATIIARYGVDNPMKNANVALKSQQTQIERYGSLAFNTNDAKVKAMVNSHTEAAHDKRRKTLAATYARKQAAGEPITRFNTVSKMNMKFKDILEKELGISFDVEYVVDGCFFDLRCGNLLVEINPSVSHASNYSFNDLVKLHKGQPKPKTYHFDRQRIAEANGFELIQVFDFTKNAVDIIKFYAAKLGLIDPVDYKVSEIRFDRPQRHIDHHSGHELEIYDSGVYYVIEQKPCCVTDVKSIDLIEDSFDVETASDRFTLSGFDSHNCRTKVIANTFSPDDAVSPGRGNFSFCTINLPACALEAQGDIDKFFVRFDELIDSCIKILKDRFEYIAKKRVFNFPFLMGQGVYINSDTLGEDDEIREVIKHSSLSVGFVGLAECLVALVGHHHGESTEAQTLGLKIVKHLRQRMDEESKETGLNWSCFATPAEGLSSRAAKINAKRFGIIAGVTDRKYVTNSFHIPVYYNISAYKKMQIEAPYHELCNAGSISYVEVDGDVTKNPSALETLVNVASDLNMSYFSINHPVDRCPVCGFTGVINDVCPKCGRRDGEGVPVSKLSALGCSC